MEVFGFRGAYFFFFSYIKYKLSKKVASKIHIAKKKNAEYNEKQNKTKFQNSVRVRCIQVLHMKTPHSFSSRSFVIYTRSI